MQEQEIKSRLPELEVRPDDVVTRDQVLVCFKSEYGWTDVMSLCNISTIIGKAKSRKTFFITFLMAWIISGKHFFIKSNLKGGNVVLFDTEQGKYHVWQL